MEPKRILIIDDNAVVVKAISLTLESNGYEVLTAADGAEGVNVARTQRPDLILLDINFPPETAFGGGPNWDGFQVMEWLRRMDEGHCIPVILITGMDPEPYYKRAVAAGASWFFQKPVDSAQLLSAIRETLGQAAPDSQPA